MDLRSYFATFHPFLLSLLFLGMGFLMPLESHGQRIYDTDYLAQQMGLGNVIPPKATADFSTLPVLLDSIEHAEQLDSTDHSWLCLQVFRVSALMRLREHKAAEAMAKQCLKTPPAQENTLATRALLILEAHAIYWTSPGLGARGTESVLRTIDMCQQAGDVQFEFDLFIFMTSIYMDLSRKDLAWEWLHRAEALLPKVDDALSCHLYYIQAADASSPNSEDDQGLAIWESQEAKAKALAFVSKAISCGEEAIEEGYGYESDVGLAYGLRARYTDTHLEKVNFLKKEIYYYKMRGPIALAQGHAGLAAVYLVLKEPDSALAHIDSSRTLVTKYGDYAPFRERFYINYFRYFEMMGNQPDSIAKYQILYYKAKADGNLSKALSEMEQYKYEYEETQQLLTIVEQQSEIESKRLRSRNLAILLIASGLILLLVLLALLRIRQRNKVIQQKNTEIERIVGELEQNLEEKNILISEVNHRVKNNLQMINSFVEIQAQYANQGETATFAESIQRRIRAVSMVHELIIGEKRLAEISFEEYALELIGELESLYFQGDLFQCHTDIAPATLDLSTTMYLGVLLNELVSNSLKHASKEGEPLDIWVSLHQRGQLFELTYRDSGAGIPESAFAQAGKSGSIGLMLVEAMVIQLEGNQEYLREKGGEYKIEFPDPGVGG